MNFSLIYSLYKNRTFSRSKKELLFYFLKLKIGEITGRIFFQNEKPFGNISKNHLLYAEEAIDNSIRKYLLNSSQNIIELKNKKGFENIGLGSLITPAMFGHLLLITQKKSSFYFKTDINKKLKLKIEFFAIPKTFGEVFFEDKKIHSFEIPTLTKREVILDINPKFVINEVSKITITTTKNWSPRYLDKKLPDFPLGIGITKISLS